VYDVTIPFVCYAVFTRRRKENYMSSRLKKEDTCWKLIPTLMECIRVKRLE